MQIVRSGILAALGRPSKRLAARLGRDESGLAAVELALILPVLLLVLAGLIDFSRLISQQMQVQAAAQAGADYALRHGWNEAGIRQTIAGASGMAAAPDPGPRLIHACVAGSAIVETSGSLCPSGAKPGEYVAASARAPFRPLLPWPGLAVPDALSASVVSRIR